jgi:hypothetical protein
MKNCNSIDKSMNSILERLTGKVVGSDYSSVIVVYQASETLWRGFVVPFDITYEAESKDEVVQVLRDMLDSYIAALHQYDSPKHLTNVPLSFEGDAVKWSKISWEVFSKLKKNISKFDQTDYYAEAQLPA